MNIVLNHCHYTRGDDEIDRNRKSEINSSAIDVFLEHRTTTVLSADRWAGSLVALLDIWRQPQLTPLLLGAAARSMRRPRA
jgi:hypothetical protein